MGEWSDEKEMDGEMGRLYIEHGMMGGREKENGKI
jgi:hypothetical protein